MASDGAAPSGPVHLARRFVWSLRPTDPDPDGERRFLLLCNESERELYRSSSRQDRRHAIDCAQRVGELLATRPDIDDGLHRQIVVAAALHDVGKTPAQLGTLGRVVATLAGPFVTERHDADTVHGWWGRVRLYRGHPSVGASLLEAAGSDPLVISWALEHHLEAHQRTIDPDIGALLAQAD